MTLLYGTANANRYPPHLLPPNAELVSSTEDGSSGKKGKVTELLPDFIGWADQIFACGPMPMYQDIYAERAGLLKEKPEYFKMDHLQAADASEGRIIEGIRKLIE